MGWYLQPHPHHPLPLQVQWQGREFLALTAHDDDRSTAATNPLLAYAVLRKLHFAGEGGGVGGVVVHVRRRE